MKKTIVLGVVIIVGLMSGVIFNRLSIGKTENTVASSDVSISETTSSTLVSSIESSIISSSSQSSIKELIIPNTSINVPVLMYHRINDLNGVSPAATIEIGLRVSPTVFDAQMKYLSDNGYTSLSSQDILEIINDQKEMPQKPIHLTFDDGFRDNYEYGFPILQKYGLIGEFAIITDVMGTGEYMSWEEAKEMQEAGMTFSSHTALHCYLAGRNEAETARLGYRVYLDTPKSPVDQEDQCPRFTFGGVLDSNQVRGELLKSKNDMENILGKEIHTIVYPYGNYNQTVMDISKELGYKFGYTILPQDTNATLDLSNSFELPRIRVFGQQNLPLTGFFAK